MFRSTLGFLIFYLALFSCKNEKSFVIVTEDGEELQVAYALGKLKDTLTAKGYSFSSNPGESEQKKQWVIRIGSYRNSEKLKQELQNNQVQMPDEAESVVIYKNGNTLFLSGSDGTGTMYAIFEFIDQIGSLSPEGDPFKKIENQSISPAVGERAISIYTMHRKSWENRLYDEAYWIRYFDLLAKSRINSFVVIFGYENGGFLAPVYPYFFDVEAFPDLKMVGLTQDQQKKNIQAFRRMIELAHERGIKFTPGIWDHIYRAGVQGGGITGMRDLPDQPVDGLVWGLNADNLADYTKIALRQFVDSFPDIDGIQFRMHWESGLTREETPKFWGEIFDMLKEKMPGLSIDLRTKDLPDVVIQDAIDKKLNFRLTTKYWMEQMGLPFHPMHINTQNQFDRRHGYADLLTYPQHYKLHWRLWNGGTARILLWGDPEYVTRFIGSTKVYGGNSFEINEPLATKMEAQPHDMEPFDLLNEPYRYYTYEFERYWYFFELWGRLAYNPVMDQAYFSDQFKDRFGESGSALRKGLHLASKILPRIIASAYHYRFFPTTRGWVEKMRMEDLPEFAKAAGTDIQLFASAAEEASLLLQNGETAKVRPLDNAMWFQQISDSILVHINLANAAASDTSNKEFTSTITDLQILAHLATYYAHRIPAAVYYNVFLESKNLAALDKAITEEEIAINSWQGIVQSAGDKYTDDLRLGFCEGNMCGHWRDELEKLNIGLGELKDFRDSISLMSPGKTGAILPTADVVDDQQAPFVTLLPLSMPQPFQPVVITAKATDDSGIKGLRLRYRHLTQFEDYQSVDMIFDANSAIYTATIPGDFVDPKWDLMYFIEAMDTQGNGKIYPDFEKEMPYVIVELGR